MMLVIGLWTFLRAFLRGSTTRALGTNEPNENALGELVDPQATPVQQVVAQGLWQAAMRLPPGQREALLLNRIGGLRHEEVARVTGASPAAVRVALHRALRSLREGLGRP